MTSREEVSGVKAAGMQSPDHAERPRPGDIKPTVDGARLRAKLSRHFDGNITPGNGLQETAAGKDPGNGTEAGGGGRKPLAARLTPGEGSKGSTRNARRLVPIERRTSRGTASKRQPGRVANRGGRRGAAAGPGAGLGAGAGAAAHPGRTGPKAASSGMSGSARVGGGNGGGRHGTKSFLDRLAEDPAFQAQMAYENAFIYLRPRAENPYDLYVINASEVDESDYYTVSQTGVMHNTPGETEFTPLFEFERHYYLFQRIRQIPFFAKYRAWKSFTCWKKGVRGRKMAHCKEVLEHNLFLLNPRLREALLEMRGLCLTVGNAILWDIDPHRTYELREFVDAQKRRMDALEDELEDITDDMASKVLVAASEALKNALVDSGFDLPDSLDDLDDSGGKGCTSFTERAALRTHCRRITAFVRLIDFLVVDAYLTFGFRSATEFLELAHEKAKPYSPSEPLLVLTPTDLGEMPEEDGPDEEEDEDEDEDGEGEGDGDGAVKEEEEEEEEVTTDSNAEAQPATEQSGEGEGGVAKDGEDDEFGEPESVPLFVIHADLGGEGEVEFKPDADVFMSAINTLINSAVALATSPPRLIAQEEFEFFVRSTTGESGPLGEGMPLQTLMREDPSFNSTLDHIHEAFSESFVNVEDHATLFEPFQRLHALHMAEVEGMTLEAYRETSTDALTHMVGRYERHEELFKRIPSFSVIGFIQLDSAELCAALLPSPTLCLQRLQELVPRIASELNAALLKEFSDADAKVAKTPTNVSSFVEVMKFLRATVESFDEYEARYAHVMRLFGLMEDHGMSIDEEDATRNTLLRQTNTSLKRSIEVTEGQAEENTQRFAKELEESVPKLRKRINEAVNALSDARIATADSDSAEVVAYVSKIEAETQDIEETAQRYSEYQEALELPQSEYDDLAELKQELTIKAKLWRARQNWEPTTAGWRDTPFLKVDADGIGKEVAVFLKAAVQAERVIRGTAPSELRQRVRDFSETLPVVNSLRTPSLKQRHWESIHKLVGFQINDVDGLTLGQLIDGGVGDQREAIEGVATEAVQEAVLESMLGKVAGLWAEAEYELMPYKDTKEHILGGIDEVTANLDDSLVNINTILGSRYVGGIREEVDKWQANLVLLQETLDEWLTCQRNWMYLETIFSAPDIQRQLPSESAMFFAVDGSWKDIMHQTYEEPNCVKATCKPGLKQTFVKHNETLDRIQKSLEEYLETKRCAFPRFYFLSNDELLEILAQTKDPQAVQPHLRKCFDNIVRLHFGSEPGSTDILAMQSSEGEVIQLGKNLKARGNVEDWLTAVEKNMRQSLYGVMRSGVEDYSDAPRKEWVLTHTGQVVATVAQIMWSRGTELALRSDDALTAMRDWHAQNIADLGDLTVLVRSNLTKLQRKVVVALVTTDVHARDIVETLVNDRVTSTSNFTWQQQLRYYWDEEKNDVLVHQANARIDYGYEYEGCTSRLVITPLTDRCWMTLTGSLGLKLGAAPAGPAGTGKTESSKDLAKALGIQCIVFNCSDQIDYKMMGKLFAGLAQAGCWTCLDEFNRIDIEVLSVIAQQLLVLRQGRLSGVPSIMFEGRNISLRDCHVIITMNPGYAGRTELPDNLKVMFRPVAMMVPDYALIAEIMLFAEGFDDAKNLSRKMTRLYMLCSQQLSQQRHYDYGLRAVKSVLVMAGGLKRGNPDLSEDIVLIRALRDSNLPKFLSFDIPLFFGILTDLFPGVEVPYQDTGDLEHAIRRVLEEKGYQLVDPFINKIIQIDGTMNVRFGLTIVGPTGAGKTVAWRTLAGAITSLREADHENENFQIVRSSVLNPKCISMGELYGEFNDLTQEWTDGLASTIMRGYVADETEDRRWTVFDGPIDALWIENMNTVLDDNMTLCLANGERIKLKPQMKMVFEVQDLEVASPATVSRLGVVYMTPEDLGWLPSVQSWWGWRFSGVADEVKDHFFALVDRTVEPGIKFVRKKCAEPVATVDIQLSASLCRLFESLAGEEAGVDLAAMATDAAKDLVGKLFAFCYVYSLGGSVDDRSASAFDDFARDLFGSLDTPISLPNNATMQHYFVDPATRDFKPFEEVVPKFEFKPGVPYFELMVPTVDTVRYSHCMEWLLRSMNPVFFTGVTGTGKTALVASKLEQMSRVPEEGGAGFTSHFVMFSAQTSARVTQESMESKLEKKRKTLLGAPAGKRMAVVIDDVNMPSVEEYGAQPPVELLRQFCDLKGFYDREKLFWKDVQDTVLVVAAAPPGGGRAAVTPRFVRHFNVLCMPPSSQGVLTLIFESIFGGFLDTGFASDVKATCRSIVASTIEVYARISAELLPTPARSHYTFNLRDVSKVFQGMLMVTPPKCRTADTAARLWIHEVMRVFHDRLISFDDRRWFTNLVVELLARNLKLPWSHEDLFEGEDPILFGDWIRPGADEPPYEQLPPLAKVQAALRDYLDEYNLEHPTQMHLVFFTDAVEHISRITRILRQPRGNALLVGVGGSGKQSLTRLAAYISGMDCFQIEITRGYGLADFREDLKTLMRKTGVQGKGTAFLFTDNQIVEEGFVEDINNTLNSGEVPNLFERDEEDQIVGDMRPVLKEMGIPETRDNCLLTFVNRVRNNLHMVLCMSPVGEALRVRCRQFPSLINCTTIDWFFPWPRSALRSVADKFLQAIELPSNDVRTALVECCVEVHSGIANFSDRFLSELRRHVYTTPKSYLDMIGLYEAMLAEKREKVGGDRERLVVGVTKLEETNDMVAGLREELKALQPVLEVKKKEAEELLKQVEVESKDANIVKEKVAKEEAEVRTQTEEVSAVQADAQADLDKALPALKKAVKALDALDKKDITEMKSFAKPPAAVQMVMEAVCLLMGEKQDWDTAKRVMADSQFMSKLKEYDKDNIPENLLRKLRAKYVKDPNMAVATVEKVSRAATSICMWVHAMDVYSDVAKEVEPKRQRLEAMNKQLRGATEALAEKQAALKKVMDKVEALERQCKETVDEKNRLVEESEKTKQRLVRAEKLTGGLADEGARWKVSVEELNTRLENLVGDMFLSAACVSYYGAFTGAFRKEIVTGWESFAREQGVPASEEFSLMAALGDPVQLRDWQIAGLPTDSVSADSAVLVTRGRRWPLMIDPQGQANKWVKNSEAKNALATTKLSDPNMLRLLEACIRNGKPMLIENVGEVLDPALEPVLQRAVFKQGTRTLIRLGDSDVDYDENFRLYITTKMPNPHYLPEVCIKVTVINFTVTMDGLEDQLLGNVVSKERADVEEKRQKLVVSMAADQRQLKEIEEKILRLLSESTGNILDDEVLISTLGNSKRTSSIISERMVESEKTNKEIDEMREQYRCVATRGSIIYFVIADLASIDPMYQYSLDFFARLFNTCIEESETSDVLDKRLANIIDFTTDFIYRNVCRGLFEVHKLLFAFMITVRIEQHRGAVAAEEWLSLLRPGALSDAEHPMPNPEPALVPKLAWDVINSFESNITALEGVVDDIGSNWAEWRGWVVEDEPQDVPLPCGWHDRLTPFQRMLLLKAFREEKVIFAISNYVSETLGPGFVEAKSVTMKDIHDSMDNRTPCIFVLSTGADPTNMLLQFAKDKSYSERLHVISLGQGQGPKAEALIERSCKSGDWVLLQNCHLAKSWMPSLEQVALANIENSARIHADFRLFLSSFPASYFPVPVLQNGVKLTNEPPRGLRANMYRTFGQVVSDEQLESCSKKGVWYKLVFSLSFFHAMIQERRKFGPLGWNIRYEFNDSDLETSVSVLQRFLDEQDDVPWDALRYVTGQINYGGRVTDDWDRRCLMSIMGRFYKPELLETGFTFTPDGVYYAPQATTVAGFREYIQTLPTKDNPEVFGMHQNANIAFQKQETLGLLATVLSMQPRATGGGGGFTSDDLVTELCNDFQGQLPGKLDKEEAGPTTFLIRENGLMDSLATVLDQEIVKFNRLLARMKLTLGELKKAIKGLVVMSADLDRMYTSFLNNQVPDLWSSVGYESLKPLASWFKALKSRVEFIRTWLENGQPAAFPLPAFFFPQGFLTGVLQVYARKYSIPINSLGYKFTVLDSDPTQMEEGPDDGVICYGMYMEGGRWDAQAGQMADSRPGEMFAEMRPIHFLPQPDYAPEEGSYTCPVYKTSERKGVLSTTGISTNYVVDVHLPTDKDPNYWVWKGCAFLLNLDD